MSGYYGAGSGSNLSELQSEGDSLRQSLSFKSRGITRSDTPATPEQVSVYPF